MSSKFYNNAKTFFLMLALMTLMVTVGQVVGGRGGMIIALGMAIVTNFVAYFFSDKIALMSMGAHEVGREHPLYQIVEPLAQRAGLPMPRVYVSPQQAPNAFATGRNPRNAAVCATEGLLQMLDRNEVAGVMAHELAHVRHRDILIATIAATVAGAIGTLAHLFMFWGPSRHDDEEGGVNPIAGLAMLILAPIAAMLVQAAISRSREFNADKAGAEICGNPQYLATALEKIHYGAASIPMDVNPAFNALMIAEPRNAVAAMAKLFSSHPPLEERLLNLIGQESTGRIRGRQYVA